MLKLICFFGCIYILCHSFLPSKIMNYKLTELSMVGIKYRNYDTMNTTELKFLLMSRDIQDNIDLSKIENKLNGTTNYFNKNLNDLSNNNIKSVKELSEEIKSEFKELIEEIKSISGQVKQLKVYILVSVIVLPSFGAFFMLLLSKIDFTKIGLLMKN